MVNYLFQFLFILGLFTSGPVFALSDNNSAYYPAFNFKDWPKDIIDPLKTKYPELVQKKYTVEEIDTLIKKLHTELNFDELKVVEKDHELFLVGTISSKIESIKFSGLKDLDDDDALEILSMTPNEATDSTKLALALDRLQSFYKNKGYRKAQVESQIVSQSSTKRELVIQVKIGDKTLISDVKIQGLPVQDSAVIEDQFNWYGKGDILSDTTLKVVSSALRRSLNSLGYYLVAIPSPQISFSADEKKAKLIFNLNSSPKYKVELITSPYSYSVYYLENEILQLPEYFTTDSNFGSELAEKIRLFYIAHGFDHIQTTFYERKEKDLIILTLNINEGSVVHIKKINVGGSLSRPESYYISKFQDLASSQLQEGLLIREDVEKTAKNLVTALQNEGFVTAKLTKLDIDSNTQKSNQASLYLQIEEGPQTTISSIKISGNKSYSTEKLLEILQLSPKQKLNLNTLEKAINKLKVFYADNGYIESKLLSENEKLIQYSENLEEAQLNIEIFEGPQIKVAAIVIEGNLQTHEKVVITELDFKPGNLLTPAKLEESIARLQRTGLFSTIEIYTLEANTAISERTVVVRVAERKPGIFTSGAGFTNENQLTLQGYLGVAYRNIGGWGRGASARAEGKYNPKFIHFLESKVTFGFLEPYLLESRVRFRLNYTSSRQVTDINIRKVTLTNQTVWSLEQDFTSHLTGIYELLNVSNYVDRGIDPTDEINYGYTREDLVIATTGPTLDLDYRDNIFNPQKGNFSRLHVEYSGKSLGNHNVDDFVRTEAQTTFYTPLSVEKGIVWANSLQGGYIKNVKPTNFGIPFDKKGFILGGRSTIRGFESNKFFPSSENELPINYKLNDFSAYELIKSELRFPLWGSRDLAGAIFYDGGEVSLDQIYFEDRYRDAAGVALRYNTPVGPLNLEYARKLDRKSYESEGAFYLSVGVF